MTSFAGGGLPLARPTGKSLGAGGCSPRFGSLYGCAAPSDGVLGHPDSVASQRDPGMEHGHASCQPLNPLVGLERGDAFSQFPQILPRSPASSSLPCPRFPSFPLVFVCSGAAAERVRSTHSLWVPSQGCSLPPHRSPANLTVSGQFSQRVKVKSSQEISQAWCWDRGVEES